MSTSAGAAAPAGPAVMSKAVMNEAVMSSPDTAGTVHLPLRTDIEVTADPAQ
jgi:hypothetical protein